MVIFNDADIDKAVDIAQIGLFLNQGQCCCASSRLFVQEDIYDEFVKRAVAKSSARVVGDPKDPKTEQGPQVSELQFNRIMG